LKSSNHYSILKLALESGKVQSIREIQEYVPITVLTVDMQLNYNTLSKRLLDPGKLTIGDVNKLAALVGVDSVTLFRHIEKDIHKRK